MRTYIAGPMRGYQLWNFPAFTEAAARGRALGIEIVSPAELDIAEGFDPAAAGALPDGFLRGAIVRDVAELAQCDAIALLPGWEASRGVAVELTVAKLLGLQVLDARTFAPVPPDPVADAALESVCAEADRLTRGDRNAAYGHPLEDFTKTAAFWSVIFGVAVTPEQVGMAMICLKISREMHRHKRDNLTDICGYGKCLDMIAQRRAEDAAPAAA